MYRRAGGVTLPPVKPTSSTTTTTTVVRPTTSTTSAVVSTSTTTTRSSVITTSTRSQTTTTTPSSTTTSTTTRSTTSDTTTTSRSTKTDSSTTDTSSSTTTTTTQSASFPAGITTHPVDGSPVPTTYRGTYTFGTGDFTGTDESGAVATEASSNKGFLANKGAAAATFSIVSILATGVVLAIVAMVLRRHNRARRARKRATYGNNFGGGDDFYEKDAQPMADASTPAIQVDHVDHGADLYPPQPRGVGYPPSVIAYPPGSTSAAYGATGNEQGQYDYSHYNPNQYQQAHYPTSQQSLAQEQDDASGYDAYIADEAYPATSYVVDGGASDHGLAPPSAFRGASGRGSGMDQSIDSFYGGSRDSAVVNPMAGPSTHA